MNNIILIGMPGSGKSTLWKELSKKLNLSFLDFDDDVIETSQWKSVWKLSNELSQNEFIKLEEDLCLNLHFKNTVFSTSWSLPYSQKSIQHLKTFWTIIYLQVDIQEIMLRAWKMKTERIIWLSDNDLYSHLEEREELYISSSDIIFNYSGNNIKEITHSLIKFLWTQ